MKTDYKKFPSAADYATNLQLFDRILYKLRIRKLTSSHEGCLYNVGRFGWNLLNPLTWIVLIAVLIIGLFSRSLIAIWGVFVEWIGLFDHECESIINKDK